MFTQLVILLVMLDLPDVFNSPLQRTTDTKSLKHPVILTHEPTHIQHIHILPSKYPRKKKAPNLTVIPLTHQLYVPAKFHVLPPQSNVQSSVHTSVNHIVSNNVRIPVVTQTVAHSSNITHSPSLILIPIQHNLVPVHDLTVLPLQRTVQNEKTGHYRTVENKSEEDEEPNRYRTFYGGYGAGLFFGGHGAGHGFYSYGK
ncbi:uncharacterized protein LOC114250048 [Bombyx mandarina]|uniref:Uncharacterized protein LOC114250048 n=1 Tax=Bombyx mandarina TaxID=7092 RepID=A0A6J2KF80_BOMMA|nr:uncharacterized protein LOC114250048 [Bombyx mandarina]